MNFFTDEISCIIELWLYHGGRNIECSTSRVKVISFPLAYGLHVQCTWVHPTE